MLSPYSTVFLLLILLEAAVALGCLAGLLFDDPGVVRRTAETCLPIPQQVADRLVEAPSAPGSGRQSAAERAATVGMQNIVEADRTYCVRCFVWRESMGQPGVCEGVASGCTGTSAATPVPMTTHHCSTCQRCVRYFDHHCGVFGRCIAGRGLEGNMKYFTTIIMMGWVGAVTCVAAVIVGVMGVANAPDA